MLDFGRGKIITVLLVVLFGGFFAVPNLFVETPKEDLPGWWQPVNLGLDLRGGSYLLMEVGVDAVRTEQFTDLQETTRQALRDAKIGYRNLAVRGDAVTLALPDPTQMPDARRAIAAAAPDVVFENQEGGRLRITLSEQVLRDRKLAAVTQSIEIVRRPVDAFGTSDARIQRQGQDRSIV